MPETKVAVFIDGSNLYHKLKEVAVKHTSEFNYAGLCQKLTRDRQLVFKGYYVGVVRAKTGDVKGQALRTKQIDLFNRLRDMGITIRRGYLLENGGKYHEKGVDVQIATDLLIGAYENQYDAAIIISSDTDLIPAINKVRALGKQVEYVGFSHQPSFALQRAASWSYLLPKEELEKFEWKDENKKVA